MTRPRSVGTTRRRVLAAAALAIAAPSLGLAQSEVTFTRSPMSIRTSSAELKFDVELALTPDQRSRGLMFRESLAPFTGMLFDFENPQPVSMWMMNTKIPLDMLFVAPDGTIIRIAANTEPFSTRTIESGGMVRGVIEIAGGSARMLGIKVGDHVLHPVFGTAH